jgi:putative transposase
MARLPRYGLAHQPQHVIQRGNNRQAIFSAGTDYGFFLEKLQAAAEKHGCAIYAYVLMTNHVHLLVSPDEEHGIGKMMQMLGRYYVQYYNYRYRRTGTLWEGRYRATPIDTEQYLLTCMRYIELNPVRANDMVGHPSEYPWSSYRSNALGEPNPLLTPHLQYQRLGKTAEERQAAYRQLFRARIADETLDEIREATNKAWALGDERFKRKLALQLDRPNARAARGGDRRSGAFRNQLRINRVY